MENKFGLVYKPDNYEEQKAQDAKVGFKFCQDIFLMKSFLDQWKISYELDELEEGPMGLGIRIKKR